jgi:hypothetical protein
MVQSYWRLADRIRFIAKLPAIKPFVALCIVAVVAAEITLTSFALSNGIESYSVFHASIV